METILKVLAVFTLGAVELWAAVPAGLAMNLHPLLTAVSAGLGAFTGAALILVLGEGARAWLARRRGHRDAGKPSSMHRVWVRYGVAGVGLLAPLLVGAPLGTVLGLAFGAPAGRLLLWMSLGIVLCSGVLTFGGALGIAGVRALVQVA
ncbi:MAG: small multi-drug export protein [Chloroflexi bacterium]|nr:small multi-drug export protein [Chloroflexota bacterium]